MARRLYPGLRPGALLTADRTFYSFDDWAAARATGADLLWRVGANIALPVVRVLTDGTYDMASIRRRTRGTYSPRDRENILALAAHAAEHAGETGADPQDVLAEHDPDIAAWSTWSTWPR